MTGLDQFATIADWHHFGILSLIETKGFKNDMNWIAQRLGISAMEAKIAVERLVRLGILDTQSKNWKQIGGEIMIENEVSTAATQKLQKQVLNLAEYSLENDSSALRDISSLTIAIDPASLPLAAEEIRKFKIYLMNLLEKKGTAREVYHLGVQLYPVTRKPVESA